MTTDEEILLLWAGPTNHSNKFTVLAFARKLIAAEQHKVSLLLDEHSKLKAALAEMQARMDLTRRHWES